MNEFNKIIHDIVVKLEMIPYKGDLSDIGNEIGCVIGKYIKDDKLGYEMDDFLRGVKHGISLSNGTHL